MKLKAFYKDEIIKDAEVFNTYFFFLFDKTDHETYNGLVIDKRGDYSRFEDGWIYDEKFNNDPEAWPEEEIIDPNTIPRKRNFIQVLFEEFSNE